MVNVEKMKWYFFTKIVLVIEKKFEMRGFSDMINQNNQNSSWKKLLGFRNMQENLENMYKLNFVLEDNTFTKSVRKQKWIPIIARNSKQS